MTAAQHMGLRNKKAGDGDVGALREELTIARAHIAALEQLLEVHEQTSLEQATRLEDSLREKDALLERERAARADQVHARQEAERAASELRRTTEALARSNRDLDQFAYVASHDLKAPLRGIANLAQWLEEDLGDNLSSESRNHMDLLRGRVHRMEALIDGILEYSRAGRVHGVIERVDVGRLLVENVELLAPPPETRVEIASDMPLLETERVPLQQVFLNLISNAIKYNRREGARVTVSARDAGDCWEFSVADNGPGIALEYHEKIWQIFQTLEARDKVEGTGIGLSVVKKIVETRGGRIWLESAPGEGSTFRFTWHKQPPLETSR